MEFIKKVKIVLVLLLIGLIVYVAPLSVETFAPAKPLMPWQQFFSGLCIASGPEGF